MNNCPICSNDLLRHIGHGVIYWFCPHCWQELPNLESLEAKRSKMRSPEALVSEREIAIPHSA